MPRPHPVCVKRIPVCVNVHPVCVKRTHTYHLDTCYTRRTFCTSKVPIYLPRIPSLSYLAHPARGERTHMYHVYTCKLHTRELTHTRTCSYLMVCRAKAVRNGNMSDAAEKTARCGEERMAASAIVRPRLGSALKFPLLTATYLNLVKSKIPGRVVTSV